MHVALSPVEGEIPLLLYFNEEQMIALANSYGINLEMSASVSSLARHLFHGGHCFLAPGEPSPFRDIILHVETLYKELIRRRTNPETAIPHPVTQDALLAVP